MYKVKRFSISDKTKLGLAAVSMPLIGAVIGAGAGYHGPSKKEISDHEKWLASSKKVLKESEDILEKVKKSGRRNPNYEEDLKWAEEGVEITRSRLDKANKKSDYLGSNQYNKDNSKKLAGKGARYGTTAGIFTGLLAIGRKKY